MKKKTGSLTVETAMVLPIFMILVIALLSSIEMMKTYSAMEYAVHETAKELASTIITLIGSILFPLFSLNRQDHINGKSA